EITRIWDVDARLDAQKELAVLHGHALAKAEWDHNVACTVSWSPDGKRLASASPDGTILLRDTATWQEVLALRPPARDGWQLALGPPSNAGTLVWSPDRWQLGLF